MSFLRFFPPMGIYETLYAFQSVFGRSMGEPGTHPWSQGFPRTDQLPGGPEMPRSVEVKPAHLFYPKAWGMPALREALAAYYRRHYGAAITADNVMVFAGGRPALVAVLLFLEEGGDGGFYHWCRLPEGLDAAGLNARLFPRGAAVLKGTDCDMARGGDASPLKRFFRFSFGPLPAESFDGDIAIMRRALRGDGGS